MKFTKKLRRLAFVAASCSLAVPQLAMAQSPTQPFSAAMQGNAAPVTSDVSLENGGVLRGQLVDPNGNPVSGSAIQLEQGGAIIASTSTQSDGTFAITGVAGGSYVLASTDCNMPCRLWAPGTAPPSTKAGVLMVSGSEVVRGSAAGATIGLLGNPWFLGGVTAAAIAVPLALDHDRAS